MSYLHSVGFLILFTTIALVVVLLLLVLVYRLFISNPRRDYDILGSDSGDIPHEFLNDEEALHGLSEEYDFQELSPEEQASFFKGQEFTNNYPPLFGNIRGKSLTSEDESLIRDLGIAAFEFEQDDGYSLQPKYVVADKTEIHFDNNDLPYSTATSVLNYCLPTKNRTFSDTIYFETKIYEFSNTSNSNGHFSIGLVTKPYPKFRLPGYNNFSIAYESTGNLKINKPFPTPLQQHLGENSMYNALVLPPLEQADIVGFGYHIPTGTVFITRNGKKIMDVLKGLYVDVYPAIGCFLTNSKFHVNLGQLGFVWIEANVRKYGFISTSDYRKLRGDRGLTSLPEYKSKNNDQLLEEGEALPPLYPEEEIDFFGRKTSDLYNVGSSSKQLFNEKQEEEEIKEQNSSSTITNDPEEVMDLRERLYERNITVKLDDDDTNNVGINETSPLLSRNKSANSKESNEEQDSGVIGSGDSSSNIESLQDLSSTKALNSAQDLSLDLNDGTQEASTSSNKSKSKNSKKSRKLKSKNKKNKRK